jgi:hypothetical protein
MVGVYVEARVRMLFFAILNALGYHIGELDSSKPQLSDESV